MCITCACVVPLCMRGCLEEARMHTTFINFFSYKTEYDLFAALKAGFIAAHNSRTKLHIENVLVHSGIESWEIDPQDWDYPRFCKIYKQVAADFFYIRRGI